MMLDRSRGTTRATSSMRLRERNLDPAMVGATFGSIIRLVRGRPGARLAPPRSVLIVRLDEIGDVVLTSPLIREVRRAFPEAWMALVVRPLTFNLVERCPHVDEVLAFPYSTFQPSCGVGRFARVVAFAARRLWRRRFDVAIVPRWDTDYYQAAWLAFASVAARRIGYAETVTHAKAVLNRGQDRLFTDTLSTNDVRHEAERALETLTPLGANSRDTALEIFTDGDDEAFAEQLLGRSFDSKLGPLIAMCAGAGRPERKWPIERFVELGHRLQRDFAARLVLIGGSQERELGDVMRSGLATGFLDTTGTASLRQAAAVLRRCDLYVGNNTGPMHLAAAVGTPVVEISCHPRDGAPEHPFSPARFGPWGVPNVIVQPLQARPPCELGCLAGEPHCILEVSVNDACLATTAMLETRMRRSGVGQPVRR